jgi:hypothetical protein
MSLRDKNTKPQESEEEKQPGKKLLVIYLFLA